MNPIKAGSTDQSVILRAIDATTGEPKEDIAYNSAGISLWYRRDGGAKTAITPASLGSVSASHTDGGIIHIDDGYCRLDGPDAAFAGSSTGVLFGGTADGTILIGCYVPLVAYDPQDAVRMGMSALPNAAANATGGLATIKRGGTAQAGASSSITLDAGASSSDDFYIGDVVQIISGTGAGQSRIVTDYVGSTKVATVDTAWTTNPSSDSVFVLIAQGIVGVTETDVAEAVLDATASSHNTAGTIGEKINDIGAGGGSAPSVEDIVAGIDTDSTQLAAIRADTEDIQSRIPAALVSGRINASVGAMASNVVTADALASDAVAEIQSGIPASILDAAAGVETGMTMRQALRVMLASLAGKVSGGGTTTITFRNVGDTKDRIVATVDGDGNRSAVTLDLT